MDKDVANKVKNNLLAAGYPMKFANGMKQVVEEIIAGVRSEYEEKLNTLQDQLYAKEAALNKSRTATKDWFDLCKQNEEKNKKAELTIKAFMNELQQFQFFNDKTEITEEWLDKYFDKHRYDERCWIKDRISVTKNIYGGKWNISVFNPDMCNNFSATTIGQVRNFLSLCGEVHFANTLK